MAQDPYTREITSLPPHERLARRGWAFTETEVLDVVLLRHFPDEVHPWARTLLQCIRGMGAPSSSNVPSDDDVARIIDWCAPATVFDGCGIPGENERALAVETAFMAGGVVAAVAVLEGYQLPPPELEYPDDEDELELGDDE